MGNRRVVAERPDTSVMSSYGQLNESSVSPAIVVPLLGSIPKPRFMF